MSASTTQHWTFTQASPLGDVSSSLELTPEGLHFRSDAALGPGSELLRWGDIAEAATTVVDLPAGKGGPDMVSWMPGRLEWLLVARNDRGARAVMQRLPEAPDAREAIVAALRQRLGSRWLGEMLPMQQAQKRFHLSARGDTLKVAALVLSVIGVLFAMLLLVSLVSAVALLPAGFLLGGWCFRRGLVGLRDALHASNTPTAKVSSAALGRVELQGRAITDRPTTAGVSGRPCVWWDVSIDVWSESREDGGWRQVMARHGGSVDTLLLEDETGRVPVWLQGADLLLQEHTWESDKHVLPARGVALLEGTAFAWHGGKRIRVREKRMEADGPVYVFGTLDEARHLPAAGGERGMGGLLRALRTGSWRQSLLRSLPTPVRAPVGIAFAYLEMLFAIGNGGARKQSLRDAVPPVLPPSSLLVWKGRTGHALIVSDRRETEALTQLRKRSLWMTAIGAGILCYCLHELINLF